MQTVKKELQPVVDNGFFTCVQPQYQGASVGLECLFGADETALTPCLNTPKNEILQVECNCETMSILPVQANMTN